VRGGGKKRERKRKREKTHPKLNGLIAASRRHILRHGGQPLLVSPALFFCPILFLSLYLTSVRTFTRQPSLIPSFTTCEADLMRFKPEPACRASFAALLSSALLRVKPRCAREWQAVLVDQSIAIAIAMAIGRSSARSVG
jgi:hypothetical protein